MSRDPTELSEPITVLVFKDGFAAKTFQIPLRWISRLGLLVGACAGVTFLATFFALKYYRTARLAAPTRVLQLESELDSLRSSNRQLETRLSNALAMPRQAAPAQVPEPVATTAEAAHGSEQALPEPTVTVTVTATPTPVAATAPVPTVTVTVTAKPEAPSTPLVLAVPAAAPASGGSALLFTALPAGVSGPADKSKLAFKLGQLQASWRGNRLRVRFNIQYTGQGGSQSGRIVVIGRGRETLITYPYGVLNPMGAASLINPAEGEYFSVSRFRQVDAEFDAVRGSNAIDSAEIMIFDTQQQLLAYERVTPVRAAVRAAPPAVAPAKPAESAAPEATPSAPATPAEESDT